MSCTMIDQGVEQNMKQYWEVQSIFPKQRLYGLKLYNIKYTLSHAHMEAAHNIVSIFIDLFIVIMF